MPRQGLPGRSCAPPALQGPGERAFLAQPGKTLVPVGRDSLTPSWA